MQPQPVEDRLSAGRHPLMLGLGLVGGGDRHHFHLVELMLANKPACVAPGGACFRPETGGQRCKPQRQRGSVHYLLAVEVGERPFRSRDKPAAVGGAEQIVGELRKLAGAEHRLRSAEHTSELQSLMRISYAVSCLTKNSTAIRL